MNLGQRSGLHICFYYVNLEHLFINLYKYIKQGIENNQLIYISVYPQLYNKLIKQLTAAKIPQKFIKFHSAKELILNYKKDKNYLAEFIVKQEQLHPNYNGIKWIGQPTYAINQTSKEDFLDFEKGLTSAFKGTNSSILCIYDFHKYLQSEDLDDTIIKQSHLTHPYILSEFELTPTNELFNTHCL